MSSDWIDGKSVFGKRSTRPLRLITNRILGLSKRHKVASSRYENDVSIEDCEESCGKKRKTAANANLTAANTTTPSRSAASSKLPRTSSPLVSGSTSHRRDRSLSRHFPVNTSPFVPSGQKSKPVQSRWCANISADVRLAPLVAASGPNESNELPASQRISPVKSPKRRKPAVIPGKPIGKCGWRFSENRANRHVSTTSVSKYGDASRRSADQGFPLHSALSSSSCSTMDDTLTQTILSVNSQEMASKPCVKSESRVLLSRQKELERTMRLSLKHPLTNLNCSTSTISTVATDDTLPYALYKIITRENRGRQLWLNATRSGLDLGASQNREVMLVKLVTFETSHGYTLAAGVVEKPGDANGEDLKLIFPASLAEDLEFNRGTSIKLTAPWDTSYIGGCTFISNPFWVEVVQHLCVEAEEETIEIFRYKRPDCRIDLA